MTTVQAPHVRPSIVQPKPPTRWVVWGDSQLRRFTVDEYHHLIHTGCLSASDHVELIDGFIVNTMPKEPIHEAVVLNARRVVSEMLPAGWHVRTQSPVTLSGSEPEPDLSVAPGNELDWVHRHPGPADVPLVVEVANTSLASDRMTKAVVYAFDGVPVYIIVNLSDWRLEVYTDPTKGESSPVYRRRIDVTGSSSVTIPIPGAAPLTITADQLLPPQIRPKT